MRLNADEQKPHKNESRLNSFPKTCRRGKVKMAPAKKNCPKLLNAHDIEQERTHFMQKTAGSLLTKTDNFYCSVPTEDFLS